jgi:pre-peptidase
VSTQSNFFRRLVSITFSGLVLVLVTAPGFAQNCPTELAITSGFTSLASGDTATAQKGVDEWDGDVIKFQTTMPGVVAISGTGIGSQSSLYTNQGEDPAFVDSARLGTDLHDLQAVAPPGDYCVQVRPPAGATGDFTVAVAFTDVCHLGNVDDHGESFLCATPIAIDGSDSGEIDSSTANDVDVFTFTLGSAATVTIESSGSTDVDGSLFDEQGTLITADADSGSGANFLISRSLAAGRYYVRVEGADGVYGISVND